MTDVRAGRIPPVADNVVRAGTFRLAEMTALEFLLQITDVMDSNPETARHTITYVDRFKMQRVMIMEVNPVVTRSQSKEH
jgi:AAA+ ATPase superfamily predicted ATPase